MKMYVRLFYLFISWLTEIRTVCVFITVSERRCDCRSICRAETSNIWRLGEVTDGLLIYPLDWAAEVHLCKNDSRSFKSDPKPPQVVPLIRSSSTGRRCENQRHEPLKRSSGMKPAWVRVWRHTEQTQNTMPRLVIGLPRIFPCFPLTVPLPLAASGCWYLIQCPGAAAHSCQKSKTPVLIWAPRTSSLS